MTTNQNLLPRVRALWLCAVASLASGAPAAFAASAQSFDPAREVDPFIGVDGGGNVFPGATLPFGLVSVSPDVAAPQSTSGYVTGKPVIGFSHNHSSGTGGGGRYGNLLVMPQSGPLDLAVLTDGAAIRDEAASPGYYTAVLGEPGIKAEVTASARGGVHRYTFPAGAPTRVLVNIAATRNTSGAGANPSSSCTGAQARVVSDRALEGQASFARGWGAVNPHTIYFAAEFDRPFSSVGGWQGNKTEPRPDLKTVAGTISGLYAEFGAGDQSVGLKVGVSYLSLENARKNLADLRTRSFEQIRAAATDAWNNYLGRVRLEGEDAARRKIFYTALYRSAVMPNDVTGEVPGYPATTPHFWNFYCIWDTYHTVNPLYTLIAPETQSAILRSLLSVYEKEGWLPDAWIAGGYASVQGGTHVDTLFADAFVKGLGGFDREKAYEAIRKNATEPTPPLDAGSAGWGNLKMGRFGDYFTLGYLPLQNADFTKHNPVSVPVSRTVEYAVNDAAVATVARILGKKEDAARFAKQSENAWNLFNPETKFFWAKDRSGQWVDGFKPNLHTNPWAGPFYEGTPWHYAFAVRHDIPGLIARHGGEAAFVAFLDQYFDGRFHSQANQPTLLTPWLYVYAGRPDKTVDRVRHALQYSYRAERRGLPGNDDAGTMSAWYVFATLGLYPVTGQDIYLLASPLFPRATLQVGGGKTFTIVAKNLSAQNRYVRSATLNGRPLDRAWLRHALLAGATLELEMGTTPSDWGTRDLPPSALAERGR